MFVAAVVIALLVSLAHSKQSKSPKRLLVLDWYDKDYVWNVRFDQSFKATLESAAAGTVEYYPEYLETNRFPGEKYFLLLHDYLRQKYANRTIDVVVANSDASLDFLLKYRYDLFPNAPIVFVATRRPTTGGLATGPGLTGIINVNTHRQTLDLALRLHPATEQVFVISGTLQRDKKFEQLAREELRGFQSRIRINYLTDIQPTELITYLKVLPRRSVILYVWQQAQNEEGNLLESADVLGAIAGSAPVPIYGMSAPIVGRGLVGGYVITADASGRKAAEIALRVANGVQPKDIPVESAPAVPMFDWRELQRWKISEDKLPRGSEVLFERPTFWDQYKWYIMGALSVCAVEALLIAFLLIERRRRQHAKTALDRLNAELEERVVDRTSALAAKTRELEAFAYSVAHDLKAPLRGIEGYSRLLLEDHIEQLDQDGREFLYTIRASTNEMSQLIEDLLAYSRLESQDITSTRIELRPLIESMVKKKRNELGERKIDFVVNVDGGSVVGDVNRLAQALRNYLDNAIKFTSNSVEPQIEIGAEEMDKDTRVWVRDNGVGFDMKYHDKIFEIFTRLHRDEEYAGTGIGLAIVRKAVERMKGRVWAESSPGRGATFYLEIPKGEPVK
jgi:signal transduction histidine kinase